MPSGKSLTCPGSPSFWWFFFLPEFISLPCPEPKGLLDMDRDESSKPELDVFNEKGDSRKIKRSREHRAGCQNLQQFLETSAIRPGMASWIVGATSSLLLFPFLFYNF